MQVVIIIPFRTFQEKISITKKYDRIAKMEVIDDKYIYIRLKETIE